MRKTAEGSVCFWIIWFYLMCKFKGMLWCFSLFLMLKIHQSVVVLIYNYESIAKKLVPWRHCEPPSDIWLLEAIYTFLKKTTWNLNVSLQETGHSWFHDMPNSFFHCWRLVPGLNWKRVDVHEMYISKTVLVRQWNRLSCFLHRDMWWHVFHQEPEPRHTLLI